MLSTTVVSAAGAQHVHPPGPAAPDVQATTTLTVEQVRQLLAGDGMGLAKPAELQGYPGPKHLLDRSADLGLSPDQERRLTAIRERMLAAAKQLGREIVDAERNLDASFASKSITAARLAEQTAAIAALNGRLRSLHLEAHLAALPLLTPEKVERYYGRQ
jgi:Spy/CpxP family protein refolding chaperone